MAKKEHIVQYSVDDLADLQKRGRSHTDWARSAAMTEADIEASVAADVDELDMAIDWGNATIKMPQPKSVLNIRIDSDVLDFFKRTGRGYQTRINAVLRAFVEAQQAH